ncbi:MAG: hypothetical protein HOZ81_04865 [Streptomyces sp.]|nr:hypothetical protein [Streptomyces sp.]
MSAREVIVHALACYYHDSADPKAAADRLLDAYDAEVAAELASLRARVNALQEDAELLSALDAAGVDSWEGYDGAVSAARQATEGVAS